MTDAAPIADGDFTLNSDGGFSFRDEPIKITPREHQIIRALMEARPAAISVTALAQRVDYTGTGNAIKVWISRIRQGARAVGAPNPIMNDRPRGYRWRGARPGPITISPNERELGFWVKCRLCDHCWIACYYPAEAREFARIVSKASCPKCGDGSPFVAKQENGRLTEDAAR